MDEIFTRSDIEVFVSFTEAILSSKDLTEFLSHFLEEINRELRYEYTGVVLNPIALSSKCPTTFSLNNTKLKNAYHGYLRYRDAHFNSLVEEFGLIHRWSNANSDHVESEEFFSKEVPEYYNREFICSSLNVQNTAIGYLGQIKVSGLRYDCPSREIFLHQQVKRILETCILYHHYRDRQLLLAQMTKPTGKGFVLLLYPDEMVEFVKGGDRELAEEFLDGSILKDSFARHPAILDIREKLEQLESLSKCGAYQPFRTQFGCFSLSVAVSCPDCSLLPLAVVGIEKVKGVYPFDVFTASHRLTERENQILHKLAEGHSNETIAHQLGISEQTVKRHVYNIYEKVGCCSRTQLISLLSGCREED